MQAWAGRGHDMNDDHLIADTDTRREWVEPDLFELKISDTAFNPRVGRDGGFADCSLS
jgi:hypothetical protein